MDLDHERLDVYHLALDFLVLASEIIEGLPRGRSHLSDQSVFHGPNSAGRSRHGTPVRRHHKTASTNFRLSFPRRPGPRLSARIAAIFPHFRSSNWSRTIDSPVEHTRHPMESNFLLSGHGHGHGHVYGGT